MDSSMFELHASSDYILKLEDFEGPLDLLLKLINDAELDIATIKISEITDQYMQYMNDIDTLDLDKASDFIEMAAMLLQIKSYSVLPISNSDDYDDEYGDDYYNPEEELRMRLMKFQIFQETAQVLRQYERLNMFHREPVYDDDDIIVTIKNFNLDKLIEAYAFVLAKEPLKAAAVEPKKIEKEKITVAEKITYLADMLVDANHVRFFSLFKADYSKDELLSTFLALLQLVKCQFATCVQEGQDGDIIIELKDGYDYDIIKDISNMKEEELIGESRSDS